MVLVIVGVRESHEVMMGQDHGFEPKSLHIFVQVLCRKISIGCVKMSGRVCHKARFCKCFLRVSQMSFSMFAAHRTVASNEKRLCIFSFSSQVLRFQGTASNIPVIVKTKLFARRIRQCLFVQYYPITVEEI